MSFEDRGQKWELTGIPGFAEKTASLPILVIQQSTVKILDRRQNGLWDEYRREGGEAAK